MVWLSAQMLVALFVGKRNSRPWIVSDELWSLIEPLLPEPGAKLVAGRPRVPDRQALCGILFVLHTGIQWEYPAPSPGCTASGAYASAGKDATTSTKPSSASPPASSPTDTSNAFVRTS
jgi:hypothetical protein